VTTHAEALRTAVAGVLPGPGWVVSLGRINGAADKGKRYAVIRPAGGSSGDLIRRPLFTVDLMGLESGDAVATLNAAEDLVRRLRAPVDDLVFTAPGEPSFTTSTEGRPIASLAVAALADLVT
jgi:hypothetical protein